MDLQVLSESGRARVEALVSAITRAFETAAVALEMFKTASAESMLNDKAHEEFQHRRARSQELRKEVEARSIGDELDLDSRHKQDNEVARLFLIEQWKKGAVPSSLRLRKVAISSRAFIFALDEFEKCLKKLVENELPNWAGLKEVYNEMLAEFPTVYDVRNTAHHIEDRILGEKTGGKPIVLPIKVETSLFISESAGIFIENIDGTRYMTLLANGQQGCIDISDESMDKLGVILKNLYACFTWKGRETLLVY
ncbi:hypothetical protein ACXX9E_18620 [Pseudomonas sp. GNP014]